MSQEKTITLPGTGGWVYHKFRALMRFLYRRLGGTYSGTEHFPADPDIRIIIACNHTGRIEPFWVHVCAPRPRISSLSKISLFKNPFMAWFMPAVGAIPVDRGASNKLFFRTLEANFKAGNDLLLFPQGTRCKEFTRESFKAGVGYIARANEAWVIPAHFWNKTHPVTGEVQPLHVRFGPPISPFVEGEKLKDREVIDQEVFDAIKKMEIEGPPEAL